MTTNPSQGKRPDPADTYGGYGGYRPARPSDDPYGAYGQQGTQPQSDPDYEYGQQQQTSSGQRQQQQQSSYQPPESVLRKRGRRSSGSAASVSQGTTSQEDRKFALFSYLGFCFTGLFFFVSKRKQPYVRFHAAQSIFLFAPVFAALLVLGILSGLLGWIPLLGGIFVWVFTTLRTIIAIPAAILWLYLMFTSWRGQTVKLPIIGDYAERFANGRKRP